MSNIVITYRVTGRYMTGSTVSAYHLVGCDGSQVVANKDRVIYMLGKGLIENMRLQANGGEMIIRGKGINLNNLSVFDINKGGFRNNAASKSIVNSSVTPKKNSGVNPMGQLTLTKRIMYKQNCLGYIVTDHSGNEKKLSRTRVVELATQRLLSNAIVQKYVQKGSNEEQLVLRGMGCDIRELPIVAVDKNGNIIDTVKAESQKSLNVRAARMRYGGIVYDKTKKGKAIFEPGDYIICSLNGKLKVLKQPDAQKYMTVVDSETCAICDEFLDKLTLYPVEIFGRPVQLLSAETIKKWPVVKITKA